jgi:hypothetical protein
MLELLRDPVWQFAGAVLAAAAIFVSVAVFLAQRQQKRILYDVIANIPILSVNEEAIGDFEILFKGLPVSKVRVLLIELTNVGNAPITTMDYQSPLSIEFKDPTKVLAAEIAELVPNGLNKLAATFNSSIENSGRNPPRPHIC